MFRCTGSLESLVDRARRKLLAILVVQPIGGTPVVNRFVAYAMHSQVGPGAHRTDFNADWTLMATANGVLLIGRGKSYTPSWLQCPVAEICHAPTPFKNYLRLPSLSRGCIAFAG